MEKKDGSIEELNEEGWITDHLVSVVDVTSQLNNLNKDLRSKYQPTTEMYDNVSAFGKPN